MHSQKLGLTCLTEEGKEEAEAKGRFGKESFDTK